MAENEHSSGPWTYGPANEKSFKPKQIHAGTKRRLIFQVIGDSAETEANARLVAAAPELLDALEEALYGLEQLNRQYEIDKGWRSQIIDRHILKAKAAIAKAKGGPAT